jgi:hypothetical protein
LVETPLDGNTESEKISKMAEKSSRQRGLPNLEGRRIKAVEVESKRSKSTAFDRFAGE